MCHVGGHPLEPIPSNHAAEVDGQQQQQQKATLSGQHDSGITQGARTAAAAAAVAGGMGGAAEGEQQEEDEEEEEVEDEEQLESDDVEALEVEDEEGLIVELNSEQQAALAQELEHVREELSAQKSVVAGLRGELRKYTQLTAQLEQQIHAAKALGAVGGSHNLSVAASNGHGSGSVLLSVSSTAVNLHATAMAARVSLNGSGGLKQQGSFVEHDSSSHGDSENDDEEGGASSEGASSAPASPQPAYATMGLEADKRLALYREALAGATSMAVGSMREELQVRCTCNMLSNPTPTKLGTSNQAWYKACLLLQDTLRLQQ